MKLPLAALACVFAAVPLHAEDKDRDQPYQGMDVVGAYNYVKETVSTPDAPPSAKGKPWEADLGNLTSRDPRRHNPAMVNLIRRGPVVLSDLAVLAKDRDPQIRARVIQVASFIGTDAGTAIVLERTRDEDKGVRKLAAVGLGRARGPAAFPRLLELLSDPEADIRAASAEGLATLMDPRALGPLTRAARETDDIARRTMTVALTQIANQPTAALPLAAEITARAGAERQVLVDAAAGVGDPRLCPALTAVLGGDDSILATRAARALAADGDSRALEILCRTAHAGATEELRATAATTLRALTGYEAAAGPAWKLWWEQHHADAARLRERDEFLADLHDPARTTTADELARFSVDDLAPLVNATLDQAGGATWWPRLAYRALAADHAPRWTPVLMARIKTTTLPSQRIPIIILLDQLGDPSAADELAPLLAITEGPNAPQGPERVAIQVALERRGR
jgi:hypothetical protein